MFRAAAIRANVLKNSPKKRKGSWYGAWASSTAVDGRQARKANERIVLLFVSIQNRTSASCLAFRKLEDFHF